MNDQTTVAGSPPWTVAARRPRPTWGLVEGEEIAPGRTVLRRLGGGSRYEVLLVWDDARFAVLVAKLLRPDQIGHAIAGRDLRREADALQRLAHPVLVRGFDAVLAGPFPHLLIEHLDGPTLLELCERHGGLPPEQIVPLALHVAAVLHYLAGERMVHLDVKPSNVVMGAPPRLIDLSVARDLASAARLRRPVGTDGYMAPEQCDPSRGAVGPPADVFGLCATVHHALTGAPPFPRGPGARESADPAVRFPQLVGGPAPLPRATPPELAVLVTAGLAPEPAARPLAAELAVGLEPLVPAH